MRRKQVARRFDAIVDFAGVETFLDTPVKHYSSGMYMRLAFAVAAHLEPEILIVDEVLAVGDADFQRKCLRKIEEIAQQDGRTIILVSHTMASIEALCDRAIYLDRGRVAREGPAREIVSHYLATALPQAAQELPLAERTDRTGSGKVRFTSFHVEDGDGTPVTHVASGRDVGFVLGYEAAGAGPSSSVDVGISVHSRHDTTLFVLYSSYSGRTLRVEGPAGAFRCTIPRLPLAPGRYRVGARDRRRRGGRLAPRRRRDLLRRGGRLLRLGERGVRRCHLLPGRRDVGRAMNDTRKRRPRPRPGGVLARLLGAERGAEGPGPEQPGDGLVSYAQQGEDMILHCLFQGWRTGFYVDVGAYHPTRFSNTYFFYQRGWRGINIDAMPGSMDAFRQARPEDVNLECAIAADRVPRTYYRFDEPAVNGFSRELSEARASGGHFRPTGQEEIPTMTLAEVLEAHLPPGRGIDFLSVDVEGLDLDVLRSNDWSKYRPTVVVAEDTGVFLVDSLGRSGVVQFLRGLGFVPCAKSAHTVILADETRIVDRPDRFFGE